jgi:hypothetical protein
LNESRNEFRSRSGSQSTIAQSFIKLRNEFLEKIVVSIGRAGTIGLITLSKQGYKRVIFLSGKGTYFVCGRIHSLELTLLLLFIRRRRQYQRVLLDECSRQTIDYLEMMVFQTVHNRRQTRNIHYGGLTQVFG